MRKQIIHPTHRKFHRLLRNYFENGTPVVLIRKELAVLFKFFSSIPSPTLRNQVIYREALRGMNRPLSVIQQCSDFVIIDDFTVVSSLEVTIRKHNH